MMVPDVMETIVDKLTHFLFIVDDLPGRRRLGAGLIHFGTIFTNFPHNFYPIIYSNNVVRKTIPILFELGSARGKLDVF